MNKTSFSELKKRLKEVNSIIKNLDPAIRFTVFDMMRPYVEDSKPPCCTFASRSMSPSGLIL